MYQDLITFLFALMIIGFLIHDLLNGKINVTQIIRDIVKK